MGKIVNQKTNESQMDAKTRSLYILSIRDPPQTHKLQMRRSRKTLCKLIPKERRNSNAHIK